MWETITSHLASLGYLEITAVVSFIIYVILAARQNPACWPVSMVGNIAMIIVSFEAKLYADIGLYVFYFIISVYGYFHWRSGPGDKRGLPISKTNRQVWIYLTGIVIPMTLLLGLGLNTWTDSDVAFWDAGTTTISFAGTWLLARKKIENWWIWIFVDLVYVGLYYYKGLILLSGLHIVYVIIAIYGLNVWLRKMYRQ